MIVDVATIDEIGGARIIEYCILTGEQSATGNTTHHVKGEVQSQFAGLAICSYPDTEGYYLFYCNQEWKEVTDTFHEDIESAKRQADFEFEGLANVWKKK